MHILFLVARIPYPPKDGGAIATFHLMQSLRKENFRVAVIGFNTDKQYRPPDILQPYVDYYQWVNHKVPITFQGALKNLLFSNLPYNFERYYTSALFPVLRHYLHHHRPDLIQLEGAVMGVYVPFLKKIKSPPIVLRAHNVEFEIWKRVAQNTTNPIKRFYLNHLSKRIQRYEHQLFNEVDGILAITPQNAQYIQKQLQKTIPVQVLFPTFTTRFAYTSVEQESPSVGILASWEWYPNQEGFHWFMERVYPLLSKEIPIYIAGRALPEEWKKQYPYSNLHWVGEVEDAQQFLKRHAVVAVPLLSGSGIRIKIVEGLSLGKFIVTTSVGAEGIAHPPCNFMAIHDSPKAFANAIIQGIKDKNYREQVKKKGFSFAQKAFSWQQQWQQLKSFYHKVLEKG